MNRIDFALYQPTCHSLVKVNQPSKQLGDKPEIYHMRIFEIIYYTLLI